VVASLLDYHWPGNVAELETIAKRIAITNRGRKAFYLDPMITERMASARAQESRSPTSVSPGTFPPGALPSAGISPGTLPPGTLSPHTAPAASLPPVRRDAASLDDAEIAAAMRDHRFKIKAAAVALGVSRSWLNTRLESCAGIRKAKELGREEILGAASATGADLTAMAERLEVSEHGLKLRMKALELQDQVRGGGAAEE
jgi:DNA-binding NtrC family response regulator